MQAKKACRPDERYVSITASDAQVDMQALCEKEVNRIMQIPEVYERIHLLVEENKGPIELEYIFKYGCDGTSGCTQFQQLGAEASDDGCVQASHLVSLQIITKIRGQTVVVYTNPLCNSAVACRPLRYDFT